MLDESSSSDESRATELPVSSEDECEEVTDAKVLPNKILVVFEGESTTFRDQLLDTVFGVHDQGNIVKQLSWDTKYYAVEYDLYVDECVDIHGWLNEVNSDDYEELRDLLTMIIIVRSFDSTQDTKEYNSVLYDFIQGNSVSVISVNTNSARQVKDTYDEFLELDASSIEFINYHDDRVEKETNECKGMARLKEIIDTHPWTDCKVVLKNKKSTSDKVNKPDLEYLIDTLKKAKIHYQKLSNGSDGSSEEAEQFALQMATDIANNL
ncbi:Alpha and gamma adaptin binding protein p34 [Nakaseomyces glabratus]